MGSIKTPRLSDAEIVARYKAGEGQGMLSLRARVPVYRVAEILKNAGCLRTPSQVRDLAGINQAATCALNQRRRRRF
jgi:hypothetical protein